MTSHAFPIHWPTESGQRSGFIDAHGHLLRTFDYFAVTAPSEGLAFYSDGRRWKNGSFWGVMTEGGDPIAPPRFTSYKDFVEGGAVVAENESPTFSFVFGFLGRAGGWLIPPRFRSAYSLSEGAAYAKLGSDSELFSLVDPAGNILIDRFALGGGFLRGGLAMAYAPATKRFGFRNRAGEWIIPARFTGAHDFSEGLAAVLEGPPGNERVLFIDAQGNTVIPSSVFESAESGFAEGLACVYRTDKKHRAVLAGYLDKTGREVIACRWRLGTSFSEGLAAVMDASTELWGYIDRTGQIVIEPRFAEARPFQGGLARVRTTKRVGPSDYINQTGATVWKAGQRPAGA